MHGLSYNLLTGLSTICMIDIDHLFPLEEHSHFHTSHSTSSSSSLVSSKLIALVLMAMLFILQGRSHEEVIANLHRNKMY